MSVLVDLFKYALGRYYPENPQLIDDTAYPSKKEKYNEWFNSVYVNGTWYIGEKLDDVLLEVKRSIVEVFVLYDLNAQNEFKYGVGLVLKNFQKKQKVNGILNENNTNDSSPFILTDFKDIGEEMMIGGQLFYYKMPNSIKVSSDMEILDYVKYDEVGSKTYQKFNYPVVGYNDSFNIMEYSRFMNNYKQVMDNVEILIKVEHFNNFLIRLWFKSSKKGKITIDTRTAPYISMEKQVNGGEEQYFEYYMIKGMMGFTFEYENGMKIYFENTDKSPHDWKSIGRYIIDY